MPEASRGEAGARTRVPREQSSSSEPARGAEGPDGAARAAGREPGDGREAGVLGAPTC